MKKQPSTIEELRAYCYQRALENSKRAEDLNDSWHAGKADTYKRIADKLLSISDSALTCSHCGMRIEQTDDAVCGWRHSTTQMVRCLLDAKPWDRA